MKFTFTKEINLEIRQVFYGIIAVSTRTYDGVDRIIVDDIDWNNEEVIFKVDQPCGFVACNFNEVEKYVFETEAEAAEAQKSLDFNEGLYAYDGVVF